MVCADDDAQAAAVAALGPDVIIVEAPDAIAAGAQRTEHTAIAQANSAIWRVNPDIRVLHGAGINCAQDVYDVIAAGAQGTGSSSAIVNAPDPQGMLEEMIKAVREAWNATNRE